MTSEIHYSIFKSFHYGKETNVEIIVGKENFRKYALACYDVDQSSEKDERICTRNDIDQFLIYHDSSYFDEKEDRDVFEEIMKKHKNGSNENQDMMDEEYHPPKIDDFKVYWIYNESVYRYTENWVQTWVNLNGMETHEIVKIMVDCGKQMIVDKGWGWYDIVVVEVINLKVEDS